MAKKQFKSESKRILDLMVNSIYTNKEIFLRELISNASDAIDKLYFRSLQDGADSMTRGEFAINLSIDGEKRTLTIADNGIGMTKTELEQNLGTIAKSGSREFTQQNELGDDIDIIGQFGVGFYSAFMVAKQIEVVSLAFGEQAAWRWQSAGADGYTIAETQKDDGVGTRITLTIKDNTDEDNYDEFLDPDRIAQIVKKYSDYVRYPIRLDMQKMRLKQDSETDYESYTENETLNSMVPLWRKNKSEVSESEYYNFYQDKFYDYEPPLDVIHQKAEGTLEYQALLFIPARAEYNFYSSEFERGLQLYSSGVMIMEKCAELLPEPLGFMKGLVDTSDISLNISREMLQHDRQLVLIKNALEKRIVRELGDMQKDKRESYEKFWGVFGLSLKFGVYKTMGANKELYSDLLMFLGSNGKLASLKEYVDAMPEDQTSIYYAAGESAEKLALLPQAELVKEKGYELLYLTDEVDEFLLAVLGDYAGKPFQSISSGELDLLSESQKAETELKTIENKEMLEFMRDSLGERVGDVRVSARLKNYPVCIVSEGAVSLEMEKVLGAMPNAAPIKANRVLELGADHAVFKTLQSLWPDNKEKLERYADILYNQALLIEGLPIEDPVTYTSEVAALMVEDGQ